MMRRGDVVNVRGSFRVVLNVDRDGVPRVGTTLSQPRGRRAPLAKLLRTRELDDAVKSVRAARLRADAGYVELALRALDYARSFLRQAEIRGDDTVGAVRAVVDDWQRAYAEVTTA